MDEHEREELANNLLVEIRDLQAVDASTSVAEPRLAGEDLALTSLSDGTVALVTVTPDGKYRFVGPQSGNFEILYTYSRKAQVLEESINELESLVNSDDTTEARLQRFFEQNSELIRGDEYQAAHSQIVLERHDSGALRPDFVLQPSDTSQLCDLLDLKLPSQNILVAKRNRQRFSAAVFEACAQLREYGLYFDDPRHRDLIRERYGLVAYRPRLIVVIGRLGGLDPVELRKMSLDVPQLTLRTYDGLLARARRKLAELRR